MRALLGVLLFVASTATAREIKISVRGMVCGFCAQGITKKFSKETAVENVQISLENQFVILKLRSNQDLQDFKVLQLISDAGFTVSKIERTP